MDFDRSCTGEKPRSQGLYVSTKAVCLVFIDLVLIKMMKLDKVRQ